MSQAPGSFRPGELDGADPRPSDGDLAGAFSMARELEAALPAETVGPSAGFADRVMAAVALEPQPRAAGFLAVLRARPGLAGVAASVREAWAVVVDGSGRPARARGVALAYVLAVLLAGTSLTGLATYGAAGMAGLLDADRLPTPTVLESPERSTAPTPSVLPTPTLTPSPSPTASPEPTRTTEPGESSEPEGSAGGGATPAASDGGGSSPAPSLDDVPTSEPSDTPDPSDTPKPSQMPN